MATNNSNKSPFPVISDDAEETLRGALRTMYAIVSNLGDGGQFPAIETMIGNPEQESRILNRAGKALQRRNEAKVEARRAKVKGRIDAVIAPWRAKKENAVQAWMGLDADTRENLPLPSTYTVALTEFESELNVKGNDLITLLKDFGLTVWQKEKGSAFFVRLPHPQPPTVSTSDV